MRVISLFSGSQGNATLVDLGHRLLLIDLGVSAKALSEAVGRAGYSVTDITDIFITHEHGDHTHGLSVFIKKYPIPVHMTSRSAEVLDLPEGSPLKECLVCHPDEYVYDLGEGSVIEAFAAPHDSVFCVGYRVTSDQISIGIVTDLGYVTQRVYDRLCGCRAVMIEANHDTEMVRAGSYAPALKRRILSGGGHLSNTDCAEIAAALARKGTRSLLLAHLSRENNTPEKALAAVKEAVAPYGVTVAVALPDEASILL